MTPTPVLPSLPELTDVQAFQNTDREVWRETQGDFYSNSVHLTATGGLGINVGGTVYVKPPAEWHRLASLSRAPAEPVAEIFDTFGNSQDPTKCVGHVWLKARYFPPRGTKLYAHPTESAGPAPAEVVRELVEALRALVDRDFTFFCGEMLGATRKITRDEVLAARAAIAAATGESHE
jgi:hypothetical protein